MVPSQASACAAEAEASAEVKSYNSPDSVSVACPLVIPRSAFSARPFQAYVFVTDRLKLTSTFRVFESEVPALGDVGAVGPSAIDKSGAGCDATRIRLFCGTFSPLVAKVAAPETSPRAIRRGRVGRLSCDREIAGGHEPVEALASRAAPRRIAA